MKRNPKAELLRIPAIIVCAPMYLVYWFGRALVAVSENYFEVIGGFLLRPTFAIYERLDRERWVKKKEPQK